MYACSVLLPAKYFEYKTWCLLSAKRFFGSEQELTKSQEQSVTEVCPQLYERCFTVAVWKRFVCIAHTH